VEEIAVRLDLARNTAYLWWRRFDTQGLAGLEDAPPGGPSADLQPRASGRDRGDRPQALDLPFQSWTLGRLAAYLSEHRRIAMERSRLGEVLLTEGLRWRKQESWFGERADHESSPHKGR
jgi:transposase